MSFNPRTKETRTTWRKTKSGELPPMEYRNAYFKSYGFFSQSDFNMASRLAVLKMIALKINHHYYSAGYSMHYQVDLIRKYQNVEIDLKCECCEQVKDFHFMTIDHLDNNGSEHRREIGAHRIDQDALRYGFNPKYRLAIMCWDCNLSIGSYGFCPHHPEIKREIKCGRKREKIKGDTSQTQQIQSLQIRLVKTMPG